MLRKAAIAKLLLLVLALAAVAQQPPPEEADHRLRVGVKLVLLNVRVSSSAGSLPRPLAASDFEVRENGRAQELRVFENPQARARLALVLDLSGSTRQRIGHIRDATRQFVDQLSDQDEVALITVGPGVTLAQDFTSNRRALKRGIGRLQPQIGTGTRLYDGLGLAHELLASYEGRSMIVVFSDGMDNASGLPYATLGQRLQAAPSTVYTIGVQTLDDERRRLQELLEIVAAPKRLVVVLDLSSPSGEAQAGVRRAGEIFLEQLLPADKVDLFVLKAQQFRLVGENRRAPSALTDLQGLGTALGGRVIPRQSSAGATGVLLHRGTGENIIVLTDANRSGVSQLEAYFPSETLRRAQVFPFEDNPESQRARLREHIRSHLDPSREAMADLEALPEFFAQSQQRLREMAEASGGQHFELADYEGLVDVYRSVAQELRHSYLLGYYTSARTGFHRLEVQLREPGLTARTRQGFFVPFEPEE